MGGGGGGCISPGAAIVVNVEGIIYSCVSLQNVIQASQLTIGPRSLCADMCCIKAMDELDIPHATEKRRDVYCLVMSTAVRRMIPEKKKRSDGSLLRACLVDS